MATRKKPQMGRAEGFPDSLPPMLATHGSMPAADSRWSYEPKLDGYRILAFSRTREVRLVTRGGLDLGERFPNVVEGVRLQNAESIIIDGELVGFDRFGKPSFSAVQSRSKRIAGKAADDVVLFCFDVLHLDGRSTRNLPYTERRAILEQAVTFSPRIQLVHAQDDGHALFDAAAKMGMEGVIAKRKDSIYQPGLRSPDWLKVLAFKRADFLILGYTGASKVDALLVGYRRDGRLLYAGQLAGLGKLAVSLVGVLKAIPDAPAVARITGVRWIEPLLTCEVRYREITKDGKLRHPTFYRMREELAPAAGDFPEVLPP